MKTAAAAMSTATLGALVKDYLIYNAWVTKILLNSLKYGALRDAVTSGAIHQGNSYPYLGYTTVLALRHTAKPSLGKGTQSRFEFIQHCINHSTYHRGQLITIGRNVGITDAPMTRL